MTEQPHYVLGLDVAEDEELRDWQGRRIDEDYADRAAEDALQRVKGRGRPSLSHSGGHPCCAVRLPEELNDAVSEAAHEAGTSRSEWSAKPWLRQSAKEADSTPHTSQQGMRHPRR
jgi:hypothetical protein